MEFFETMDPLLKTFWFVAIPASIVFLIQMVMTFAGMDASDGVSADFDSDLSGTEAPFQLFSFRNLINFLLGFGWTGISLYHTISSPVILVISATLVGALFIVLFFFVIRQISRLAEDNSFKLADTIDKTAEVYLPVPAGRQGKGKVLVSVNGSLRELDAMTDFDRIETSVPVKVLKIENNILFVQRI